MSTTFLLACLVIAIVLILVVIIKFKINPAIALVMGALLLGVLAKIPVIDTVNAINSGFGNMLGSIGFPIGFGIILGQLVSDCGGANVIAQRLVRLFPASKAIYAVAIAAFVLSIPVFFDVTFVILIPIGVALMKQINKGIAYIVGAIAIGAGVAHTLVPPTPNPLAAADIFGFDLGIMIAGGTIIGLCMVLVAVTVYCKVLDRGLWKTDTDESGAGLQLSDTTMPENAPSVGVALIPVLLPVVLILINTVADTMLETTPVLITFLGTKTIALLAGALSAYVIAVRTLGSKGAQASAEESLKSAGIVFLITGAGGSFAQVISASGVNNAIVEMVSSVPGGVAGALLVAYFLGLAMRQITGSGTVASLTTMTIMARVSSTIGCHPLFLALACLDGALFGATINDSGFWIVTNMCGLNLTGGVKTYTLGQAIASVIGIIIIIPAALLTSMFL